MIAAHHLSEADLVAIHGALCARYGCAPGVRNLPMLRATLGHLKQEGHTDVIAQAAALFAQIAGGRPFVDGNALAAFAATDVFLRINGHRIARPAIALLPDLSRMTRPGGAMSPIESWLRGVVAVPAPPATSPSPRTRSTRP